jgi:hypothetical protein
MMFDSHIVLWLEERRDNCLRIADTKVGRDCLGWLEDARQFAIAAGTIRALQERLMEAPPDAMWVCDEKGQRKLIQYIGPTIQELREQARAKKEEK